MRYAFCARLNNSVANTKQKLKIVSYFLLLREHVWSSKFDMHNTHMQQIAADISSFPKMSKYSSFLKRLTKGKSPFAIPYGSAVADGYAVKIDGN